MPACHIDSSPPLLLHLDHHFRGQELAGSQQTFDFLAARYTFAALALGVATISAAARAWGVQRGNATCRQLRQQGYRNPASPHASFRKCRNCRNFRLGQCGRAGTAGDWGRPDLLMLMTHDALALFNSLVPSRLDLAEYHDPLGLGAAM